MQRQLTHEKGPFKILWKFRRLCFFLLWHDQLNHISEDLIPHNTNDAIWVWKLEEVLYLRFIKQEVIAEVDTTTKLLKLDPKDKKIWLIPGRLILFLVPTNISIKESCNCKQILKNQRKSFLEDCIKFLPSIVFKLIERIPLNHKVVEALLVLEEVNTISKLLKIDPKDQTPVGLLSMVS